MTSALILPTGLPAAGGWHLSDYRELTLTSTPAVGGVAVAYGGQLDPDELWLIDHMVTSATTPGTLLRLYSTSVSAGNMLDGSDRGSFDVADYPAGLQVRPTRELVAVWGAPNGQPAVGWTGTLTVQFRELRQG